MEAKTHLTEAPAKILPPCPSSIFHHADSAELNIKPWPAFNRYRATAAPATSGGHRGCQPPAETSGLAPDKHNLLLSEGTCLRIQTQVEPRVIRDSTSYRSPITETGPVSRRRSCWHWAQLAWGRCVPARFAPPRLLPLVVFVPLEVGGGDGGGFAQQDALLPHRHAGALRVRDVRRVCGEDGSPGSVPGSPGPPTPSPCSSSSLSFPRI